MDVKFIIYFFLLTCLITYLHTYLLTYLHIYLLTYIFTYLLTYFFVIRARSICPRCTAAYRLIVRYLLTLLYFTYLFTYSMEQSPS